MRPCDLSIHQYTSNATPYRESLLYEQPTVPNLLSYRDGFSRPALRHGSPRHSIISSMCPSHLSIHHAPQTLSPTPSTLNPQHCSGGRVNLTIKFDQGRCCWSPSPCSTRSSTRKPYSLHPTPYTLHPTPCTLHSTP